MNIVIVTVKSWNIRNAKRLQDMYPEIRISLVTDKEELTEEWLASVRPDYIFFPHWSWTIPQTVHEKYNCVVFHMTDLPFGRGGSPLQNLIVRGIYQTRISAIKVTEGMDTGDIYIKEDFDISEGSADEILTAASDIVFTKMIPRFFEETLMPKPQVGAVTEFKRRKPEMSELPEGLTQRQIYDYIRMLDGEGYPAAYKTYDDGSRIYFRKARMDRNKVVCEAEFDSN